MRRPAHKAFTLLEVVLAVSLTVGLMGAGFAFYSHLAKTRVAVLTRAEAVTARRGVMDRITAELRGAMRIQGPMVEEGEDGQPVGVVELSEIRFMSATLPGPSIWAVRDGTEEIPPEHDMQFVGYRSRIYEDEEGVLQNAGLERTCQTVMVDRTPEEEEELTEDERPEFTTELLAPAIKFAYFRFHNGGVIEGAAYEEGEPAYDEEMLDDPWKDTWRGRTLPLAVEVTLGAEPQPDGTTFEEYLEQYQTYRRVVYIPGTTLELQDTVSQDVSR